MSRRCVDRHNQTLFQPHLAVLGRVSVRLHLLHAPQVPFLIDNRKGLSIKQAEFAVKKYKSHRRIPARVVMDLTLMDL